MNASAYWDSMAPHLISMEDNYLDPISLDHISHEINQPVLVIGAGQGVLVEHLQKMGLHTDGVDLSAQMIRYARDRRGLSLIEADARKMPFATESYETVIVATGVVDFMDDDTLIDSILSEARRVQRSSGKILVAFYRISTVSEKFLTRLGLLHDNGLMLRESMELYRLKPPQNLLHISRLARTSAVRAAAMSIHCWLFSTTKEKLLARNLQKVYGGKDRSDELIVATPQRVPYRNEQEIRKLLGRVGASVKSLWSLSSCYIARI